VEIFVESETDRRVLRWLVDEASENSVVAECSKRAGRRRIFPGNAAKALGLSSLSLCALMSSESIAAQVVAIAKLIGRSHGYP
jgi:hypothetical protein